MYQEQANRRQSSVRPQQAEPLSQTQKEIKAALNDTPSAYLGGEKDKALQLIKEKLDGGPKKDIKGAADDLHKSVQDLDPTSPEFLKAIQGFQAQAMGEVKVTHPRKEEIEGMLSALKTLVDPKGDFIQSFPEKDREAVSLKVAKQVYLKIGKILDEKQEQN